MAMPATANALVTASDWLALLLTGTLGTILAVLAIAAAGFAMLQGRLAVRDGIRVVMGCFILFGAPSIAHALAGLAAGGAAQPAETSNAAPPPPPPIPSPPQPNQDPYAGASVPM